MFVLLKSFAIAYILFFLALLAVSLLRPFRLSQGWYIMAIFFAFSLAIWAYSFTPSVEQDLYRLHLHIDWMRQSSASIMDKIIAADTTYSNLVGFNALCYIVSLLPKNNWLSFFSVLTTVSLIFLVIIDYLRGEGLNTRVMLLALLLGFMGMQVQYVFSGIRNALSVSMTLAGLYLLFMKKKHPFIAISLLILSPTIHPSTLVVFPLIIVSQLKGPIIWRVVALSALSLVFSVAQLFQNIPIAFFQSVGRRILFYRYSAYAYDRPEMIANILVFISISTAYWLLKHNNNISESTADVRYANFYYLTGSAMVGCAAHRDFTLRMGYLMGFFAIPMLVQLYFRPRKNNLSSSSVLLLALLSLGIMVCVAKVYYDTYYVIRQWEFA